MVYKCDAMYLKTDANIVGKVCEDLHNTIGLTAENLVEVSRPDDAPLHNEFEWNDSIAAEEYRKEQARYIIRHIKVEVEETNTKPIRAFFVTQAGFTKNRVYEPIRVIMSEPSKRESLLVIALRELNSFKTKYSMLSELADVFDAIDRLNGGDQDV